MNRQVDPQSRKHQSKYWFFDWQKLIHKLI